MFPPPNANDKYLLVCETSRKRLVESVNLLMNEGWIPQGGIALVISSLGADYCQAMVRK